MQKEAFRDKCSFVQTPMCAQLHWQCSVASLGWGFLNLFCLRGPGTKRLGGWVCIRRTRWHLSATRRRWEDSANRKSSEECVGKRILCKNISHLPGHNSYIRVVMVMIIVLMVRSDSGCSLAPRRTPFYWPHSRVTPLRCCIVYIHCHVALDIQV